MTVRAYYEENGKRPDITIFNHPDHAGKFFLDVRISSPVPANSGPLTIPQAKKKFRAGNKAFSKKANSFFSSIVNYIQQQLPNYTIYIHDYMIFM